MTRHPNMKISIGPLGSSTKVQAKHYTPPKFDFSDLPARVCNSSSTQPYIPNDKTVYRDGSQVRHKSRGIGC